jgi:hypothetical protein
MWFRTLTTVEPGSRLATISLLAPSSKALSTPSLAGQ